MRNLSVRYRHSAKHHVPAVCDVSFRIDRGEIVGLSGPSGSGKTSLGLALLNIVPRTAIVRADAVNFGGKDLLSLSERQMRAIRGKRIAMMHQEAALSLNPVIRVGDQISEVIRAHEKCTRRERRAKVVELLQSVGLSERQYESYPHELSGGERHRVVIAQALACRPALVIADEPTAGLDKELKDELLKLILRFRTEMGTSFLVISHDRQVLAQIADRTLEMTSGRVRESRPFRHAAEAFVANAQSSVMGTTEDSPEKLVSIHALSKSYVLNQRLFRRHASSVQALRAVTLSILRGSSFGLTGPSGSGKSTLAECIAGWERADSGEILFRGEDLTKLSGRALLRVRARIQLVLQDSAAAFNPNLTAEEIVEEPLLIQGKGKKERRALARRLFLETGLDGDMLTRTPLTFSGGQRQRLAIARALILNPELVIFDESMTGLDTETREQILQLLGRLKAARNLTYVLISHDADLLSAAADIIATMRSGELVDVVRCGKCIEPSDAAQFGPRLEAKALATGEPA
ncbi:MAG TPA: ABC transporter ATP-binding protein [Terriglobales bacterium]|nr:ABC transporter ATP-binding protein [Terriglobales bacterium]